MALIACPRLKVRHLVELDPTREAPAVATVRAHLCRAYRNFDLGEAGERGQDGTQAAQWFRATPPPPPLLETLCLCCVCVFCCCSFWKKMMYIVLVTVGCWACNDTLFWYPCTPERADSHASLAARLFLTEGRWDTPDKLVGAEAATPESLAAFQRELLAEV